MNTDAEAFADPQVQHLGLLASVAHPLLGDVPLTGLPLNLSDTPPSIRRHPPLLAEHTAEVLRSLCGCDDESIARLANDGTVKVLDAGRDP